MNNAVFWDMIPCDSCNNRPFGGMIGSYKSHTASHTRRRNSSKLRLLLF
jgi:hypothetical protein